MHFNNSVIAANFIKKILERRDKKNIHVLHQPSDKKSLHVNLLETDSKGWRKITHHVKFSKEHFHAFGHFFKKWEGQEGESINKNILLGLPSTSIIYIALPDEIKMMSLKDWLEYNLFRETINGSELYSIPYDDMKIFYKQSDDFFGIWEFM
mgnify:CR=1 FL=1